jgi:2-aminoadipate transaminase
MVVSPHLDPASEVPLYRQLYEYFKEAIQSGRMRRGDRLPPTRELAGSLGLNRTTVSAAYELLVAQGLVAGHVGRGSFVAGGAGDAGCLDWASLLTRPEHSAPAPVALDPGAISFAASRPSEGLFPIEALAESCREALATDGAGVLQLGSPGGYEPLRRYLFQEARREGILRAGDEIIVTSGCQQALDLIRRVLLAAGDRVALEDPVYPGLKNLFLDAGARTLGIPVGEEGIDLRLLDRALAEERPKLVVVTSNFQNPTGCTVPLEARRELLGMVRRAGAVLVENDIYGALRYRGEPVPSIKQLDEDGNTVLLRSFSKVSFPGLRVGWVIGPRPLLERMGEAKQLSDLHTSQLSQAALLRFAESGRLEAHRRRVLAAGAERLAATLAACERYLPPGARFTRPEGGMNLWVRLPGALDAGELLPRAQREGVTYLPGKYFAVSRFEPGGLRLSFAGLEPERIEEGVRILGRIFSAEWERVEAARSREPASVIV